MLRRQFQRSTAMPILQPTESSTVLGEIPGNTLDRRLVGVLLAADGRASEFDLRRLIAADPDLVDRGQAVGAHETLHQAEDLQPDVVLLDRPLSYDVALLARELTSLDRAPAIVARVLCPEPVMMIAAIVAGVRGIVSQGGPEGAICNAIRWVAAQRCWLPDIPLSALSRAGSRLDRSDLPILSMLVRGAPSPDIAADLLITAASLDARRSAMLGDMLGAPPLSRSPRARRIGESAPAASEADPRIALAA
jgi:DNA-binding NarL/FixJ family response regulator